MIVNIKFPNVNANFDRLKMQWKKARKKCFGTLLTIYKGKKITHSEDPCSVWKLQKKTNNFSQQKWDM